MNNTPLRGNLIKSSARQILSTVQNFHLEGKYWDVQLQIDTEIFKCQRSLLAAISEYFDGLFSSNFKESNMASDQPIILHDIDAKVFKEILNFIYTGDCDVDDSNVFELLIMNDFLGLRVAHIKEQCIDYLEIQNLPLKPPIPNALDLLDFASITADSQLMDCLNTHLCQHLHHYSKDAKLMKIPFETLNELVKFSKNLILPLRGSQNIVLSIILTWVAYNREERSKYRSELMRNINFSNISSKFISSLINGQENFADEITGLLSNTNSFETLTTTLKEKIKTGPITDDTRFSATITLVRSSNEIVIMKDNEDVFSSSCIICNLSWSIRINRYGEVGEVLGFYLHCHGPSFKNLSWDCFVTANLNILSHKKDGSNFVTKLDDDYFEFLPYPGDHCWKFDDVIDWEDLINPEKGYMKDDSVTFLAEVFTDVPYRT